MKRFLLILLAAAMCVSASSCADGNASDPESASENTSGADTSAECLQKTRLDSVMSAVSADRTLPRSNIVFGLPYTCSRASGSSSDGSYTDPGTLLTDGNIIDSFNSYSWAGFESGQPLDITFDLGASTDGIADIEVGCLRQLDYGIGLPSYAEISVSEDGSDYIGIGKLFTPDDLADTQKYTYRFCFQGEVKARYIRVGFSSQENVWFFIDEIGVYVYGSEDENAKSETSDYYPSFDLTGTEKKYVSKDEDGATDEKNLALDAVSCHISSFSAFDTSNASTSSNSLDTSILHDGKTVTLAYWDTDSVFRFSRGSGRSVIFDLGTNCCVSRFSGQVIYKPEWGVYPPAEIGISVSADGDEWQGIATAFIDTSAFTGECPITFAASADAKYDARYVKFSFVFATHTAFSEFEIYGTRCVPSDALTPSSDAPDATSLPDSYKTPSELDGIDNILCTPICKLDGTVDDEFASMTKEEFLPYVGYYEGDVLKDTFFDSYVFSPCSGYTVASEQRTLAGWKTYLDCQFRDGRNIKALNEAAKEVGAALGKEDYSVNVFMSVLRTWPTDEDGSVNVFGDLDGDGKNESFDIKANRKKAIKWIIDTQLARYAECDTSNLKLVGFYWHEESIFTDEPDEEEIVKYAVDYVHSLGYKMIWIPYYDATGYTSWKQLGFDLACLQPNYSFMAVIDEDRLYTAAQKAKLFGMSVEIELSAWTNRANIKRYKEYLEYGVKYGYMEAVKVYYLGIIPTDLTQALAGDEYTASVYRDTYLFSKGLLDETYSASQNSMPVTISDAEYTCERGRSIGYKLEYSSDSTAVTPIVTLSPKYGSLRLNLDGSFVYKPFDGYFGEDSFTVAAEYPGGTSESALIKIKVN